MDYCKHYFGKSITDLSYVDIENFFIEPKEESNKIEFKSFKSNVNDSLPKIIQGISAFLNSEGGILIWGAPKGEPINKNTKQFKGELCPLNELIDHDRLINMISDPITPLPLDIIVKPLVKNNKYLYVFEIQKSSYSPHQYRDIYYARFDGQTKPAPHYLIEALFKKITYPNIAGYIKNDGFNQSELNQPYFLEITTEIVNLSELQNEEDIEYTLTCNMGKFENLAQKTINKNYSSDFKKIIFKQEGTLHFGRPIKFKEKIALTSIDIHKNNWKLNLNLIFGGKKSPLKYSNYIFDFTNYYTNIEVVKDENKLMSNLNFPSEEMLN